MELYIDIETIPTQRDDIKAEILAGIRPPATYSKPESIEKWMKDNRDVAFDEKWRKTALDGAFGEIISIAWAIDNQDIQCEYRQLHQPESKLLGKVFESIRLQTKDRRPTWVGHNVLNFDIRMLWQRSIVTGVKTDLIIPFDAKPWAGMVYDTMTTWAGLRNFVSLDTLCKAFGFPVKEMNGSQVWDMVLEGKYQELQEYNKDDVLKVRQIHQWMTRRVR